MFQTLFPNVVDMKTEFIEAIWQTIYMTLASAFFAGILGLATGILLVITEEGGIAENKPLYGVIDKLVNLLRSFFSDSKLKAGASGSAQAILLSKKRWLKRRRV